MLDKMSTENLQKLPNFWKKMPWSIELEPWDIRSGPPWQIMKHLSFP